MKRSFVPGFIIAAVYAPSAWAVPDCWGVTAVTSSSEKAIRITCKDDKAPGTAQDYKCAWKWKIKTSDGKVHNMQGNFMSTRGEKDTLKYEETRIDGQKINDEVEGVSISCAAVK